MMVIMDPWAAELPPFQEYLDHKLKQQKNNYLNSTSATKAVPLKELSKDLFNTTYKDNKYSTKLI